MKQTYKNSTLLINEELLQKLYILNSYYKINPRRKSNLSLKTHKYFVKLIRQLKILGRFPFKSTTNETF